MGKVRNRPDAIRETQPVNLVPITSIIVPGDAHLARAKPTRVQGGHLHPQVYSGLDIPYKRPFIKIDIFVTPPMVPFHRHLSGYWITRNPVFPTNPSVLL